MSTAEPPEVVETRKLSVARPVARTKYKVPAVRPAGSVKASSTSNTTRSSVVRPCADDSMSLLVTSVPASTCAVPATVENHPVHRQLPVVTASNSAHATTVAAGIEVTSTFDEFATVPEAADGNATWIRVWEIWFDAPVSPGSAL